MSTEQVKCPICGGLVYRNKSGKILLHTRAIMPGFVWGPVTAEICAGTTKGARP